MQQINVIFTIIIGLNLLDSGPRKQSSLFSIAEKRAGIPFIDHHVLTCNSDGKEYTNIEHDITLRIPPGSVETGKEVHIEVGVATHGSFIFPDSTQPVSPILWACAMQDGVKFLRPFQLALPHCLVGLSKERLEYHQLCFAKANHDDYTYVDKQMRYIFKKCDIEPQLTNSGCKSYGVLTSDHFCFYCLLAKQSRELALETGYCLTRIESFSSMQRSEVFFCATYFLDACLKVGQILLLIAWSSQYTAVLQ